MEKRQRIWTEGVVSVTFYRCFECEIKIPRYLDPHPCPKFSACRTCAKIKPFTNSFSAKPDTPIVAFYNFPLDEENALSPLYYGDTHQ